MNLAIAVDSMDGDIQYTEIYTLNKQFLLSICILAVFVYNMQFLWESISLTRPGRIMHRHVLRYLAILIVTGFCATTAQALLPKDGRDTITEGRRI